MSPNSRPVIVFFAFANDRVGAHYLRNLPEEQRHVRDAMAAAVEAGLCEVVERANATVPGVPFGQGPTARMRPPEGPGTA